MSNRHRPSATSIPQSPQDEESSRVRHYLLTMGIRVACLVLMVFVQPYGWYTWVFGAGAIVLPYIAVVLANVGKDAHEKPAERPELALPAAPAPRVAPAPATPPVIRIAETRPLTRGPSADAPSLSTPSSPAVESDR